MSDRKSCGRQEGGLKLFLVIWLLYWLIYYVVIEVSAGLADVVGWVFVEIAAMRDLRWLILV